MSTKDLRTFTSAFRCVSPNHFGPAGAGNKLDPYLPQFGRGRGMDGDKMLAELPLREI